MVRKDFAYNTLDNETDNPKELVKLLRTNINFVHVKTFGEWEVYRYSSPKQLFYTTSSAVISPVNIQDNFHNPLYLFTENLSVDQKTILARFIIPTCLSCDTPFSNIKVVYPEAKIFPGTILDEIKNLKYDIPHKSEQLSYDQKLNNLIGNTLNEIGLVHWYLKLPKSSVSITPTLDNYQIDLTKIASMV